LGIFPRGLPKGWQAKEVASLHIFIWGDEGIVLTQNGEAMSARDILGVEKLPRVGLFAH
jgi:hypothetical protein